MNNPDVIYRSEREKYTAIADEIERMHKWDTLEPPTGRCCLGEIVGENDEAVQFVPRDGRDRESIPQKKICQIERRGRPILVGTVSIERSELISGMLDRRGVKHQVLNAKHHKREAEIVAQAGRKNAVTIATNMAGRGTDIILGGNPDAMAWAVLQEKYPTRLEVPPDEWTPWSTRSRAASRRSRRGARWRGWAACTSSAASGTRPGASTCSFAGGAAGRATPAAAASTSRWKTT